MKKFLSVFLILFSILLYQCKEKEDKLPEDTRLKDFDENIYTSVTIGTQTWMVENLKTTHLNDGTQIPLNIDAPQWDTLSSSGYCWYNNDITYKNLYGALYNWFTVKTGKLCPSGWHVPTDAEWGTLIDYLGGELTAGGKLKETGSIHWRGVNTGATNETGFTALPGGYRNYFFFDLNLYGHWWSATEYTEPNKGWSLLLNDGNREASRLPIRKQAGLSVRCMKD